MADSKQKLALDALTEIEKLVNARKDLELLEKILFKNNFKTVRSYLEGVQAAPLITTTDAQPDTVAADVDAPQPAVELLSVTTREKTEELSNRLSHAYVLWGQIKEIVSEGIRGADKRIITISVPARTNEELVNSFDNSKGNLLMVVSTNSDAYMVTKDSNGFIKVSSARYWKSVNSVAK